MLLPRLPLPFIMFVVSTPLIISELLVGRAPLTDGFSDCEPSSPWPPGEVARFIPLPVRSGSGAETPGSATIRWVKLRDDVGIDVSSFVVRRAPTVC